MRSLRYRWKTNLGIRSGMVLSRQIEIPNAWNYAHLRNQRNNANDKCETMVIGHSMTSKNLRWPIVSIASQVETHDPSCHGWTERKSSQDRIALWTFCRRKAYTSCSSQYNDLRRGGKCLWLLSNWFASNVKNPSLSNEPVLSSERIKHLFHSQCTMFVPFGEFLLHMPEFCRLCVHKF